jgi:RNA ligase (TIGR02306 family)
MPTSTLPSVELDRALATIERVSRIRDIPNADNIVVARIRGWDVVVSRAEILEGDMVVYIETDALVPTADDRFAFLVARGFRTDEAGNAGHVLKIARFRGQYSQGLAMPIAQFPELAGLAVGEDVTQQLGIVKWDPPIPGELLGYVHGAFPASIPHTKEDRIQNNDSIIGKGGDWIATEKIDGNSLSAFLRDGIPGVAMRNYDLIDGDNVFWRAARAYGLHAILAELSSTAVVQGEVFGAGVKPNTLDMKTLEFRAFTVIVDGVEIPRAEWPAALLAIAVPIHDLEMPATVEAAIDQVDGIRSLINPKKYAEGIVWRKRDAVTIEHDGQIVRASSKVISRKYLLKQG